MSDPQPETDRAVLEEVLDALTRYAEVAEEEAHTGPLWALAKVRRHLESHPVRERAFIPPF